MAIVLAGGFSDGELVKILHGDQASNMEELYSTQEEADTRLLLHAIHASQNHSSVIIRCDDTDVMILLIYYCSLGQLPLCIILLKFHCLFAQFWYTANNGLI